MTDRTLFAVGVSLACWLVAPEGRADPSVWARARQPALESRRRLLADVEKLRADADAAVAAASATTRFDSDKIATLTRVFLRDARKLLELAGAARSRDRDLLFEYAGVVHDLDDHATAIAAHEALLALDPPPAMAAEIHPRLAASYARLKMSRLEIAAYDQALQLQPHSTARTRMLANRAEAFMTLGDLTSALEGYHAALAGLSQHEMQGYGVTTLWGLAVASDRAGDLDDALRSIRLARSYDPADTAITGPEWFYVLDYDRHWYEALGHWSAARHTELAAVRAEAYGRAVSSWEAYIASAATTEPWIPIARARLAQCQKEREATAFRRKGAKPAPPVTRPAKKTQ